MLPSKARQWRNDSFVHFSLEQVSFGGLEGARTPYLYNAPQKEIVDSPGIEPGPRQLVLLNFLVDSRGLEPLTSTMRM